MVASDDLRIWLARKLKLDDVPEPLWRYLVKQRYAEPGASSRTELLREAKQLIRLSGELNRRTPAGHVTQRRVGRQVGQLSRYEHDRALAFSEYVAGRTSVRSDVVRFRETFLDGRTLPDDEANTFVESPALAHLLWAPGERLGFPLVGHTASIEQRERRAEDRPPVERVRIRVDPPGESYWAEQSYNSPSGVPTEYLAVPSDNEAGFRHVAIWRHTVLDRLRVLARELAKRQQWHESSATWFVLTNEAPALWPLEVSTRATFGTGGNRALITLVVEPWVSAGSVVKTYREVQRRMLRNRDNSPVRERALALLRFVTTQCPTGERTATWRELMEKWNTAVHRQWRYTAYQNFARDFRRVARALLFPTYDV